MGVQCFDSSTAADQDRVYPQTLGVWGVAQEEVRFDQEGLHGAAAQEQAVQGAARGK